MTIKETLSLRNFMIILCILMAVMLVHKGQRMADKTHAVEEGGRRYAAGDLIGAEEWYRKAGSNNAFLYKEGEIADRLGKLAPITAIRTGLDTLAGNARAQAKSGDFDGFMGSYGDLIKLKAEYMKPGGSYEAYYRKLSAASGLSGEWTGFFQQFKKQFLEGLARSGAGDREQSDRLKWSLLRIPEAYYGSAAAKKAQLDEAFRSHDTRVLKALAGAGSFPPLLDSVLSMQAAYRSHDYAAPWLKEQAESSVRTILGKDLESGNISAFAGHAAAYRKFAADSGFSASKVLKYIEAQHNKLAKNAARKAKNGQYSEAIGLYKALAALKDPTGDIAAVTMAWNLAQPVRLLPGGEEQGRYTHILSGSNKYGAKVYVAATLSDGTLFYARMKPDNTVSSLSGDAIPGFDTLRRLAFDDRLGAASGAPVAVAETDSRDGSGRAIFTAYAFRPEGITRLFTFSGDSYDLQPDGSILVHNTDMGGSAPLQTAIFRKSGGSYQFAEIVQKYPLIPASDLEQHLFQNISIQGDVYFENTGSTVAYADGRYILLQGFQTPETGLFMLSGQFQNSYGKVQTEFGEEQVPVFVVSSVERPGF